MSGFILHRDKQVSEVGLQMFLTQAVVMGRYFNFSYSALASNPWGAANPWPTSQKMILNEQIVQDGRFQSA